MGRAQEPFGSEDGVALCLHVSLPFRWGSGQSGEALPAWGWALPLSSAFSPGDTGVISLSVIWWKEGPHGHLAYSTALTEAKCLIYFIGESSQPCLMPSFLRNHPSISRTEPLIPLSGLEKTLGTLSSCSARKHEFWGSKREERAWVLGSNHSGTISYPLTVVRPCLLPAFPPLLKNDTCTSVIMGEDVCARHQT